MGVGAGIGQRKSIDRGGAAQTLRWNPTRPIFKRLDVKLHLVHSCMYMIGMASGSNRRPSGYDNLHQNARIWSAKVSSFQKRPICYITCFFCWSQSHFGKTYFGKTLPSEEKKHLVHHRVQRSTDLANCKPCTAAARAKTPRLAVWTRATDTKYAKCLEDALFL